MTYVLRFRPEVAGDLEDAARWYDDRRLGLGGEFLQECKAALDRILERPEQGSVDAEVYGPFEYTDSRT